MKAFALVAALIALVSLRVDVLAHFAPLYAAGAFVAGVAGVAIRSRLAIAGAIVGLAASAVLIAPEFIRSTGPIGAPNAAHQVKVIQFNALRTNRDLDQVVAWLVAQDADVITITEASHELRDRLLARTGWKTAGAHDALIIFTPARYLRMDRPTFRRGSGLTAVNASYAHPAGEMELATAHFNWPEKAMALRQPRDLEAFVRALPTERMILTGDFNAAPWSRELRTLDSSLGLIRRDRAVATWPARVLGRPWPLPFLPIDHVYAGPGWATVKVERGPWLGSDHYPLIVTLAPVSPR